MSDPVHLPRPDPDLDLQIDSLAWPQACLVATTLSGNLDSWLNLAIISKPALVGLLRCWSWALAGVASALLAVLLHSGAGFPPHREQTLLSPDPGQHCGGAVP